jgi:hypothetical protein
MDAGRTGCEPISDNPSPSDRDRLGAMLRNSDAPVKLRKIERITGLLCTLPTVLLIRSSHLSARTSGCRGSPRDGGATVTLPAERGTMRFAVAAGVLSGRYRLWSSSIVMSLTE